MDAVQATEELDASACATWFICKMVVDNAGAASGVQIQNISKNKGPIKRSSAGGNISSVITTGPLGKLQSNNGYIGGYGPAMPGVIAVGTPSPAAQVKAHDGLHFVLICSALTSSNPYAYAEAYAECIATNALLPYVATASLRKLNIDSIGPAVCAVQLGKKCAAKKTTVAEPVVGKENVVQ